MSTPDTGATAASTGAQGDSTAPGPIPPAEGDGGPTPTSEASTAQLVSRMSEQVSSLLRDELKLAQVELAQSGKRAGVGAGLFGAAGILALYGLAVLLAAVVLLLAGVMSPWLAALIVAVVLLIAAGIAALIGTMNVKRATKGPRERVDSVKADVDAAKP